jgi:sensor histidine kinase regulating citrate/malate metabolism
VLTVCDNGLGIDLKEIKSLGLTKCFISIHAKGVGLFLTKAQVEGWAVQ